MSITVELETAARPILMPGLDLALLKRLQDFTGSPFGIFDVECGEALQRPTGVPECDWGRFAEVFRAVAARVTPEFVEETGPLAILAAPLRGQDDARLVAFGLFLLRAADAEEDFSEPERTLGARAVELARWSSSQAAWNPEILLRVTRTMMREVDAERRLQSVELEAESLAKHLAATYEEISLLYRLTQNLTISRTEEELGRIALQWLAEVIPAECLAIQLLRRPRERMTSMQSGETSSLLLTQGRCPVGVADFSRLVQHLNLGSRRTPVVVNRLGTAAGDWPAPEVRQLILVPMTESDNVFGYLVAFNHPQGRDYGTVESSLLNSVAAILGIHGGNIELYRQQAELLAGIVRALISAIDAKDPYTCGHSDRVANIAVVLARQLGCDEKTRERIYLAGLLHDIGKIGIDDQVLRKPDKLSEAEFEHIKHHPQIGHRILRDLAKLEDVLPVVLHHHESWDGAGYPGKLGAEEIPLSARIVAVADAFDAMGSDRPYRRAMPAERIDAIFRSGAGQQWDPQVINAFFGVRDEVQRICLTAPVIDVQDRPAAASSGPQERIAPAASV